jgi:hypothetical protein
MIEAARPTKLAEGAAEGGASAAAESAGRPEAVPKDDSPAAPAPASAAPPPPSPTTEDLVGLFGPSQRSSSKEPASSEEQFTTG